MESEKVYIYCMEDKKIEGIYGNLGPELYINLYINIYINT